ncbi:aminoacyl-tRNA hydrolase [soil metagenome]
MALFQKKPQVSNNLPLYTMGLNGSTFLIVGLGNPGKKYNHTRHNIGFDCLDYFVEAHDFPGWKEKKNLRCLETLTQLGDNRVILCKPTTFMNNSGQAVRAIQDFYKLPTESIIVVHDELDIPFGQIRSRVGGSAAGHNGVTSVIEHTDGDFGRLRIGIKPEENFQGDSAAFVLGAFSTDEQSHVNDITRESTAMLTEYVFNGKLTSETRNCLL